MLPHSPNDAFCRATAWCLRLTIVAVFATPCFGPWAALRADTPSADYIFPAGGQRGTIVSFDVGATFLHGGAHFEMQGEGVATSAQVVETDTNWFEGPMIVKPASQRAENYPRDHAGQAEIAKDAELGFRYWRIRTSQGVTPSRPFVVGELPEVVELEIDGLPRAQHVSIPVTANGRIFPREDVDIWTFKAIQGRVYSCRVCAAEIQSPLDSQLKLFGPDGRLVAENDDHRSADSAILFKATASGTHRIQICDTQFRGLQDYVYRLTISDLPQVARVFPLGAKRGQVTAFQLAGQGLPNGTKLSRTISEQIGVRAIQFSPPGNGDANPIQIDVGEADEWMEDQMADGGTVNGSGSLNGRILRDGEQDLWNWRTEKGKQYSLTLLTESLGSPLLADLLVEDSKGKAVKQFLANPQRPLQARLTIAGADAPYVIRIAGKTHGPEHAYRLKCVEIAPDFQLRLGSDAVTAYRGQKASLTVQVERRGFQGEIELSIDGLPGDIELESAKVPANKNSAPLTISSGETARVRPVHATIIGRAMIDGVETTRVASLPTPHSPVDRTDVLIGVSMPTPFKLDGVAFETRYGARGTLFRRHFVVHRNGFQGPLQLSLADRQVRHLQGMTGVDMSLAADKSECDFAIRIPTWLEMNRTSRTVVMAVGKVKDEQGAEHTVSFSSQTPKDQIVLLTAPCPISVSVAKPSMHAQPGATLSVDFRVDRGILQPAPVRIELIAASHMKGLTALPVQLDSGQQNGQMAIQIGEQPGPFNMPLTLRATTTDGRDEVIAETKFGLVLP